MKLIKEYEIQIREFEESVLETYLGVQMITTNEGVFIIGSFKDNYYFYED